VCEKKKEDDDGYCFVLILENFWGFSGNLNIFFITARIDLRFWCFVEEKNRIFNSDTNLTYDGRGKLGFVVELRKINLGFMEIQGKIKIRAYHSVELLTHSMNHKQSFRFRLCT